MMGIFDKEVFIMVGYPGSGKSTLCKKMADSLGMEYLSTDVIRQEVGCAITIPQHAVDHSKSVKLCVNKVTKATRYAFVFWNFA